MSKCPVCLHSSHTLRYTVRGFSIRQCLRCSVWFVPIEELAEVSDQRYNGSYLERGNDPTAPLSGYFDYERELRLHLHNFGQHLAILQKVKRSGRLLDVGCASGHFLLAAQRAEYEVAGVELSEESAARARTLTGARVWSGPVESLKLPHRFDIITVWETIEHVPNPRNFLRALLKNLSPAGILLVGTGNTDSFLARLLGRRWWYLAPPDHLVYYNPQALSEMLRSAGFEPTRYERIHYHLVSSRNVFMKIVRSLELNPVRSLEVVRRLPDVPLPILHGTTMVLVACPAKIGE